MKGEVKLNIEGTSDTDLLEDLAFDNPRPEERWFDRECFDPMHSAKQLRSAARKGWIELDDSGEPSTWRFRFTPAGRAALAAMKE